MNTEKISVNVNIVDLGKIDMLIERGIFTNRTDFLTRAIYNELEKNGSIVESVINEQTSDTNIIIGRVVYNADKLQAFYEKNKVIKLYVVGKLVIDESVSLDLAKKTIKSIKVFGSSKMPKDIANYYNEDK